jgi:polysaccharide export outer membrane protein
MKIWSVFVLGLLAAGLVGAQTPPETAPATPTIAPTAEQPARTAASTAAQDDEYKIGASDLIEISVFQVKELDRAVRVNSRGLITLPLIGAIAAAGLSATELEDVIANKLRDGYLQDPQVSVFIKEFISQRVTVEGQVEKAGIFPITGRTTLLQSLALAGGIKELGEKEVRVFRLAAAGKREMLVFDVGEVRNGGVVDPLIQNNDIVVVGRSESRALIKTLTDTLRGFFYFAPL